MQYKRLLGVPLVPMIRECKTHKERVEALAHWYKVLAILLTGYACRCVGTCCKYNKHNLVTQTCVNKHVQPPGATPSPDKHGFARLPCNSKLLHIHLYDYCW